MKIELIEVMHFRIIDRTVSIRCLISVDGKKQPFLMDLSEKDVIECLLNNGFFDKS